ncbi:MAG: PDZ domain-containing protein [Calditrichaeota bacterium]|nr:PDZ domain-containing protein [Calditrichota bacterium]
MTSTPSPPQAVQTPDPFQILRNYYQALGGFENFRSEISSYSVGDISIIGTGMKGQFRQWTRAPLYKRTELDINAFKQISGDDGKKSWVLDHSGKLSELTDETSSKRREIIALREVFKHLDPFSDQFVIRFEGVQEVNNKSCYVLQISNKINDDVEIDFFDVNTSLLIKTIEVQPEQEKSIVFSDYREIDGVKHPFRQETEVLPIGQKQLLEITEYQSNVRIDDSMFQPPETAVKRFQFSRDSSVAEIDFEIIDNHLLVPVIINGTIRTWIIDTTASISAVDWEYAQELGLELDESRVGEDNRIGFSLAVLPTLRLKGLELRKQRVAVTVVSQLFKRTIGFDIAGILGSDFLSNFTIKVDYSTKKISFFDPDSFRYSGRGKSVDVEFRNNVMLIPASINGIFKGNWKLDIGASRMSVLHSYAKANNLLETNGIDVVGYGTGDVATGHLTQFESFEFGPFKISNPVIHIHHSHTDEMLTKSGIIGIVGNSLLNNFVLYVDYHNQKLFLEKGNLFNAVESQNVSGLQLLNSEDNNITVQFVSPNSAADVAGFKKDDIIFSVNGIDIEFFQGLPALRRMIDTANNTTYEFGVKRVKAKLQIKMILSGTLFKSKNETNQANN